jgi:hypothetical protein
MALRIATTDPQGLLNKIKKGVDDKKIDTWHYVEANGKIFYTHKPSQWDQKAWFVPALEKDQLRFNIVAPKEGKVTRELFGVYHGRFTEMVLVHFENDFTTVWTPTKAESGDVLG